MQHLRSKLGDPVGNPTCIANVYGVGYKFLLQVTAGAANIGKASGNSSEASRSDASLARTDGPRVKAIAQ